MPAKPPSIPKLRHHKGSGQALVVIDGKSIYLGKYGTAQAQEQYDRAVAEWLCNGRRVAQDAPGLTIAETILAYWNFARTYYRKNGETTDELYGIKAAMRPLRKAYASLPVADFGPLKLKAVRQAMIDEGHSRKYINDNVNRIKRMFRWAVENELAPPSVYHGLQAVSGLKRGRSTARETEAIKPVPDAHISAVLPHVSRQVAAMIQIQALTGMRPGEVVIMRTVDLDTTGTLWVYTPSTHKTEHYGKRREVYIGPQGQELLRPFLRANLGDFLFAPAEAEADRNAERRRNRTAPTTPSQAKRRPKRSRKRPPGRHYTVDSYRRAIRRACVAAFGMDCRGKPSLVWHPNQLRHSFATRIRRQFGLEVARVMLGHETVACAELYAERDAAIAASIASKVG